MADGGSLPSLKLAFIGGGSGGHLFPALAVAEAIAQMQPAEFLFLVSQRPVDRQVLSTATWARDCLQQRPYVQAPRRSGVLHRLIMLPEWIRGYARACSALKGFRPDVCIGTGAASSVPGVIAAYRLRIPIVLMEQNTIPGQATRLLSRLADATLAGLPFQPDVALRWPGPLHVTGTPVRSSIAQLASQSKAVDGRGRLLILGGSQGSASVNRLVLEALEDEHCVPSDWEIIHQTGEAQVRQVADEYARRGRTANVVSFIPNLPEVLGASTVVVSRAGAGTLQELACAGLPSILIPLSSAAANHQSANARCIAGMGGAVLVEETDEDAGLQLRLLLKRFIQNPALLKTFREGVSKMARPNAAIESAQILRSFARRRS